MPHTSARRRGPWASVAVASLGLTLLAQAPAPVADAVLQSPPAAAWPAYGRDYAETHHSPLAQIDRTNVARLKLAWTADIGSDGKVEATPLVWQDTLYVTTTWSVVVAVNARTGGVKWRWDPGIVRGGPAALGPSLCCGPVNRGVALYQGKVYAGLLDGRLVALDAATGRVVWAVQTTPPGSDYSVTGAPRVVRGLVVIGNAGAEYGVRGYVTAYDAGTGAQRWRFHIVPGDPAKPFENAAMERAAATWSGEWWKAGGGGTAWDAMAYDPAANLLYIGTGNGSPHDHGARSAGRGDNLYLSSIVALRPDTGEYVWHYQTTPNDTWDFTATQPIILADLTIAGRPRQVLMQAPKNGFFYVLDRLTGEFISGTPFVPMTWATGIDATGRPIQNPAAHYGVEPVLVSPGPIGGHNWQPMAWNPATRLVYFPGEENSATYARDPDFKYEPRNPRGNRGIIRKGGLPARSFLVAWDPVAQQARWRLDETVAGGLLSTAGGLVFGGNAAGAFFALDAATGARLWQQPIQRGIATPVSYELDGTQHVAILAGATGAKLYSFRLDAASGSGGSARAR